MHALPRFDERFAVSDEMAFLRPLASRLVAHRRWMRDRPFVTLSWSQSIDGSVSVSRSHPYALSCRKSLEMTHRLRALHDALLVGVNTVLSDDPQLTVRHCVGDDPQPVVLDSRLRFPESARLLGHPSHRPIIVTTDRAPRAKAARLAALGASVQRVACSSDGRVDLDAALDRLGSLGLRSVMVEGGAQVIQSILAARLVDYCIVTIAPTLLGGVKALEQPCRPRSEAPLTILDCRYQAVGADLVAYGPLGLR
ncbi:MAG: GTP cyclohydrolase [Burkholderiales bacterium]|nr:MAG: GTP cyclohydrolase [Burkholderiales bacterium]